MAETRVEQKPGPWQITDPDWPTYYVPTPIYTSDRFSTNGALEGRLTDAQLGGAPLPWVGNPTAYAESGTCRFPQGTSGAFIAATLRNVQVTVKIVELRGNVTALARASSTNLSVNTNAYRATLQTSTGAVRLEKRVGGTETVLSSNFNAGEGDTIGVRCHGTQISLLRNGIAVATVTDTSITSGAYCGLVAAASTTPASWVDDFSIRNLDVS